MEILSNPEEEQQEESEEDSEEPVATTSSRASGGGPGWLLESGGESSHQLQLEWMADSHRQWRADRTDRPPPIDVHYSVLASSSSVRLVAPESDEVGPSGTALVVISSDSSSKADSDSYGSDTSLSEEDQ